MTTAVTMIAGDIEIDDKMIFDSDAEMKIEKSESEKIHLVSLFLILLTS